jgi:hypothetical protein
VGWFGDAIGWAWGNTVGRVGGAAGGFVWDQVVTGMENWVIDAVAWFVGRILSLLEATTQVNLKAGWFLAPDGPYDQVLSLGAVLLVVFLFVGLIQGLLAGDPAGMVLRMARDLPLAVVGMVTVIDVGSLLLQLSDAMAHGLLNGGGDDGKQVMRTLTSAAHATGGDGSLVIVVLGLFVILAALFVWVELVIRAGLIYLLVAMSPLVFAAVVWPSARGMLRKLVELILALIFSKVVIAIAFSVGAAALAGVGKGHSPAAGGDGALGANASAMFAGAVIFCLAAFAPFVVLKLFPIAEAAVAAQGISRGPLHAAQSAASSGFSLDRLAGNGHGSAASVSGNGHAASWRAAAGDGATGGSGAEAASGEAAAGGGAAAAGVAAVAVAAKEQAKGARDTLAGSAGAWSEHPAAAPAADPNAAAWRQAERDQASAEDDSGRGEGA